MHRESIFVPKKEPILKWLTNMKRKLTFAKYLENKSFSSLDIVSDAGPKYGREQ
jgi:hypothetical protein